MAEAATTTSEYLQSLPEEVRQTVLRMWEERESPPATAEDLRRLVPSDWGAGEPDAEAFLKAAKEVWGNG